VGLPNYDYRCLDCRKRVSVYQSYAEYGTRPVSCPLCGGSRLTRLLNRVRLLRTDEERLDSTSDNASWDSIDEEDPRAMARMIRRMGKELGEDVPPEFDEIVGRMESGESPESIEENFPDLGDGGESADDEEV
jgi:putative FmdB family regulatory protein